MTKVRVITRFHDRADFGRVYEVGQKVDFSDEARVRSIVERGLGEIIEERNEVIEEESEKIVPDIVNDDLKPKKRTTRKKEK